MDKKNTVRTYTDEERKLILEGYKCLMRSAHTNLLVDRKKLENRADEIKAQLGFKRYNQVITFEGKLLV